ncbi:MAG: DUF2807 domain-containing protein [Acidobacteria bacterium]|nr:DUF2807 domain-containing protein [Acidobacteriota bacterium]MCA1627620.1 DUF2807 domain-containing protein [Acidobacteriota bacterium]
MKRLLVLPVLMGLVLLPLLTAGCHRAMRADVKGSGKRVTEKRDIAPFTSIETNGAFDIEIVCQKGVSMEIEGDDNILPLVSSEVSNNVLRLKPSQSYSVNDPIVLRITVPNLEAITANGAGNIRISDVSNEKLQISSDGAPAISASGSTKMIGIDTNGAARIDTHNLRAAHAIVDSKGVSKVDLGVSDRLDVTVSGPSRVTYRGDPVVNKTVHGPGKVEKRGDQGA